MVYVLFIRMVQQVGASSHTGSRMSLLEEAINMCIASTSEHEL